MTTVANVSDFNSSGRKILGVVNNYMGKKQRKESPLPKEPLIFFKPVSSYVQEGRGDIVLPKNLSVIVPQVHLGFIIDRKCKHVTPQEAIHYVGGYCIAIDLTSQCFLNEQQKRGNPWALSKAFDTSTAVSKFIPGNKIPCPHKTKLWLNVNGFKRQWGNTKYLVFKIPQIIAYISEFMTLHPNDLILTGTPCATEPLAVDDIIECGLGKIAKMSFKVRRET